MAERVHRSKTIKCKFHTEESMVDRNSVNAQPISERAVYFSFLERRYL